MWDDDEEFKNPNLYIEFTETHSGGYILREDGGLIFLENDEDLLFY